MNTLRFNGIRRLLATVGVLSILSSLVIVIPVASAYTGADATAAGLSWAAGAVDEACDKGLIDCSLSDPKFTTVVDRATGYQMLTAGFEVLNPSAKSPFTDAAGTWYANAADTAYTMGWTVGNVRNGVRYFDGAETMSRAQLAVAASSVLGLEGCDASVLDKYTDKGQIPSWATGAMACMVENNLMVGSDNQLRPTEGAIKAEVVVVMNAQVDYALDNDVDVVEVAATRLGVSAEQLLQALDEGKNVVGGQLVVVGSTPPPVEPETPPVEPETPPVEPEVPGGALTVSAAPAPQGSFIIPDGTAFNPIGWLTLRASSAGDVRVTGLTVTKGGFVADNAVKLSTWVGSKRHGSVVQVSSEHTAEISFANDPIVVPAGSSVTVTIAANLLGSVNNGTLTVAIASADAVTSNASSLAGTFPAMGPNYQITDGASSVAAATFDVRSLRSTTAQVDIGQKTFELTRFELAESNSKENLNFKSLTLFNNGSTADGDLMNLTLKDQDGNVLATSEGTTGKYVTFNLANAYVLPLGTTRVFSVEVDVMNGATRTAQLVVQNDYDIGLEGASTAASILATANSAGTDTSFPVGDATTGNAGFNHITINEGTLTITKDNSSPSGDITKGGTGLVLGSFRVQAIGEDIELQKAALDLANGAARTTSNTTGYMDCAATATCDLTGSLRLVTDSGKTLLTINADTAALWNNAHAGVAANATYSDLSAYHTIPAGETELLHIVGNLSSSANLGSGETLLTSIEKLYYYKKSSLKFADSASSDGNTLTVDTSSLSVSSNSLYGNQTVVSGTSGVKLASFVLRAGSAEGVNITSLGVQVDESVIATAAATGVTNLRLMKEVSTEGVTSEVQVGTTQASVSDSSTVSFSTSGFQVPASTEVTVNVYGDLSSSVGTHTLTTTIPATAVSGSAVVSTSSTSAPTTAVTLQVITGSIGGTLRVVSAGANPVSSIYVAGTSGNVMGVFQLNASLAENINLKEVMVRNDSDTDDIAIGSLSLYWSETPGGTETSLGSASLLGDGTNPGYATWTFSGSGRPMIPSNGTRYLIVKANIVSSQQAGVSGLTPRISLASIKAEGINQVSPKFVSTGNATDSTGDLPTVAEGGDGAVNATGCFLSAAVAAPDTTINVDDGAGGACNTSLVVGNAGYLIPAGVVIKLPANNEQVLVTAATGTTLTVERGVNGTTANTDLDNAVVYYGHPIADADNNVIAAYDVAASFTTAGTFSAGQIIQIDTEDMYVHTIGITAETVNAGLVYVDRAVNNTTLAAHNTASGTINEYTAAQGNLMAIANTKPTFAKDSDSPSGAVLAVNTAALLAKFTVAADLNAADSSLNKVTLNAVDVRMSRTGVDVSSMVLYPKENENDGTFAVNGTFLSANTLRFTFTGNSSVVAQLKHQVDEGTSRTYHIFGNVTALAANASIRLELTNLGSAGASGLGGTALGAADTAPDISWIDGAAVSACAAGTTLGAACNFFWTKQSVTQVFLNTAALTSSSSSGTVDSTGPTVSTISFTDAGVVANSIADDSTIILTYNEPIQGATLVSGATPVPVPGGDAVTVVDGTRGDVSITHQGCDDGAAGVTFDCLVINSLLTINLGATTPVIGHVAGASTLALNSTGTVVTITMTTAPVLVGADGNESVSAGTHSTAVTNTNGFAAAATAANAANVTTIDW